MRLNRLTHLHSLIFLDARGGLRVNALRSDTSRSVFGSRFAQPAFGSFHGRNVTSDRTARKEGGVYGMKRA